MNRLLCILLVSLLQVTASVAATFRLDVEVTPHGSGSLNTSGGTYEEGSSVYLRTYNNTGYVFKGWYEGEELVSSATSFNYTMPQRDVRLTAKYEFDPTVPGNPAMPDTTTYYKLTATVSPVGAGTLNTYEGRYAYNANVSMRTYGNTGYRFLGWQNEEGTVVSTAASFNYAMPRHDSQLTALYEFDPSVPANPDSMATNYTVYVKCKPLGGGSFNNSAFTSAEGSSVRIYAYTNTGYRFIHWEDESGNVIATDQNFYYVIPHGNSSVYGVFEFDPAVPGNPNKNYWNKELGELIIDDFTTGNLNSAASTAISGSNSNDVTMITVAGRMNSNDFGIANNYKNCTLLDLSRVTGVTEVPSYAFDGTNLETVYLPATIEKIGDRAFENCMQLAALTLYAMTPPTLGSNVFRGIPEGLVVYVPAASIAQYQEAAVWKDFTILPIQEDIRSITVGLPEGFTAADFTGLWLELTNTRSGQRLHYVMTERQQYTFPNIIRNTTWNIQLRNERGDVFGQINNVEVKDEDVSVTFDVLQKPQTITLSVLTPDGTDVTGKTQITWLDADGNYLAQSASMGGLCAGKTLAYRIALPQELAMAYVTPAQAEYTVAETSNDLVCTLEAIAQVALSGKVTDVSTRSPLSGVVISASQTFAGKYSKTVSAKTDTQGNYALTVLNVPTTLSIASSDYISQTIVCDTLMKGGSEVKIADVALKPITGATISINFTYRPSVVEGEEAEVQEWYSDYNNVTYNIYNKTKARAIGQFNVQYPRIVLLEEVDEDDVLELTASSVTSSFVPVKATATIEADLHSTVYFDIVALGGIQASFKKTDNAAVVGTLYDSKGKLVKSYNYANAALTVSNLADGDYTLVSMGASTFFNNVYDLAGLPQTGLVEGKDYARNTVELKSGIVSVIEIEEVPQFDESQFYYTGDNTSFTVNKPSIVAGNYLTLTARIDFKQAYAASVSNLCLVVDLPESCQFVENSVMVGNSTSSYALDAGRLTIPVARYTDRVRFCVIPTLGGEYAPSALVSFTLEGKEVTQPIGSANYSVRDLSISAPSTVAKTSVPVSGTAFAKSSIEIYDSGILIGTATSLANGTWATTCELKDPYNLSTHNIYAKVTTKTGLELFTETINCLYDKNAIEVNTVTMINTAHTSANLDLYDYVTVFDFQNPKESYPAYWYWPSYPDFTFLVDFTNNDTTIVKDVILYVFTDHDDIVALYPEYDARKDKFVATAKFDSYSLPYNVSVDYEISKRVKTEMTDAFNEDVEVFDGITQNAINLSDRLHLELITDDDSLTVFKVTIPENGVSGIYKIRVLNFENAKKMLSEKQFDFEKSENGYRYYLSEKIGNEESLTMIDTGEEVAYVFAFSDDGTTSAQCQNSPRYAKGNFLKWSANLKYLKELFTKGDWIGSGATIWSAINDFLGLKKYCSARYFNQYFDIMDSYLSEMEYREEILTKALAQKCADGTYRLSDSDRKKYAEQIQNYDYNIGLIYNTFVSYTELYKSKLACSAAIDIFMTLGTAGLSELGALASKGIVNSGRVLTNSKNSKYFKRWITNPTVRGYLENALGVGFGALIGKISEIVNPEEADFEGVEDEMNQWMVEQRNFMDDLYRTMLSNMKKDYKKCKTPPTPPTPPSPPGGGAPNVKDPSGYVYEAVSTNRLAGVTATAYYKETVEDMYGDLHENVVKWDAEEYAQENPLFTDENGMYAWDVPNGLWQVKFEKEGYETTYSEWLPVPPPQLDVNIAMKQNIQPTVKNAHAYEDAVELEFDKYMMPELLTTDNIIVQADGQTVEGTVQLLNEEVSYEGNTETYASKIRFNAAAPFTASEVSLRVSNRVKSYAGVRMQDDYMQTFTIEKELNKIVCDSAMNVIYGDTVLVPVAVMPAVASAGKTLKVRTSSSMILSVDDSELTINDEGMAYITVVGELPGTSALTFSVEDGKLKATTIVNVVKKEAIVVATPKASIASGTFVEKGTKLTLSCETEGATIYYTIDGSCPCDLATAKAYDGPIVINETLTIKAIAIKQDMYDSDIAEFSYTVNSDDAIEDISIDDDLRIYPLPIRDKLNISAGDKTIYSVTVVTLKGSVVISYAKPSKEVQLDVRSLSPSIYIINVVTDNKIYHRKVLKIE